MATKSEALGGRSDMVVAAIPMVEMGNVSSSTDATLVQIYL